MDWKLFGLVLALGIALVIVQGIAAWFDGYLTQEQMRSLGIRIRKGSSLLESSDIWINLFIMSPTIAYAVSKYDIHYLSVWGIIALMIGSGFFAVEFWLHQEAGRANPGAYAHDGKTTFTGWTHILYGFAGVYIFAVVLLKMSTPVVSEAGQYWLMLASLIRIARI